MCDVYLVAQLSHSLANAVLVPFPRPLRRMSDVKNSNAAFKHSVKYLEWISNKNRHVDAVPAGDPRPTLRVFLKMHNDLTEERLNLRCNWFSGLLHACGAKGSEVRCRPLGIFNSHALRNDRNAASTSSCVATPLRSALSMARSSSGVAW